MIVPSIDLQGGQTVQLVGGEALALEAGHPAPIAARFGRVGEIAVIDLDEALGRGSNAALIEDLCSRHDCRVGGGIRDEATARRWLDAGAARIILGTAAHPTLLEQLPKERLIAALDARDGEVVTHGWTTRTGARIDDRIRELSPYVSGFLITFVEREGRLGGTAMDRVKPLIEAAGGTRITFAGGVTTADEVAELDRLGADAQVGMALYTGRLSLAEAFAAPLVSDRADQLWATVVVDERGTALGLCWSNPESLAHALDTGRGVYWSRRRGLWEKGKESGATQELLRVDMDCDRDALRFTVRQHGSGFCHLGCTTCWGESRGVNALAATLSARATSGPAAGSYSQRLLVDPSLLRAKLVEEAGELADAKEPAHVVEEAADLVYFAMVALTRAGGSLADVDAALNRRARRVSRRPGHAKPALSAPNGATHLRRVRPNDVAAAHLSVIDLPTLDAARRIVDDVHLRGEVGLRAHAERLGDLSPDAPLVIGREGLAAAAHSLPTSDLALLERTATRIRTFADAQLARFGNLDMLVLGGRAGHTIAPVERAGCYAPGGRYPLPSSVLMTAVTARAAGVLEVWVASPRPTAVTLAAAWVAGADSLLAVGGAHAIGALAFGAGPVPRVDVIVGPGNRWVTAAKQLVAGQVGIDMLAGPSELVVLADETADPGQIAADLLGQAEHDPDARPILVTWDADLADRVDEALAAQLATLPTAEVARAAVANGFAVVCESVEQALSVCDHLAPEHLEVLTHDAKTHAARLNHYGGLFVGPASAEVFGDYGVGPNHVLPTGTAARFTGGLSVLNFLRVRTWLSLNGDDPALQTLVTDAAAFARLEGLEAHARSAEGRRRLT